MFVRRIGLGILAEPWFAIIHILSAGKTETDQILTAMVLGQELPSQVVQQAAQLDVCLLYTSDAADE